MRVEAEKALARLEVLRDMVGAKVEELQRRLAVAKVREQLRRVSDASEAVRPTVPREVA